MLVENILLCCINLLPIMEYTYIVLEALELNKKACLRDCITKYTEGQPAVKYRQKPKDHVSQCNKQ